MEVDTDILFVQPGFVRGLGRTLDLFGTLDDYNYSSSAAEADELALQSDLAAIGKDFRRAIETVTVETK